MVEEYAIRLGIDFCSSLVRLSTGSEWIGGGGERGDLEGCEEECLGMDERINKYNDRDTTRKRSGSKKNQTGGSQQLFCPRKGNKSKTWRL